MNQILYVSMFLPYDTVDHAGGKTLNYYIKQLSKEDNINVTIVALCSEAEEKKSDCKNYNISEYLVVKHNDIKNFILKILSINSKYNPFHKNCNMISFRLEKMIINKIKELKRSGYKPDVILLEWTQIVILIDEIKKIFPDARYIASEHDVTFVGYKRKSEYYAGFKKMLWQIRYKNEKNIELSSLRKCDLILPQNPDNCNLLIKNHVSKNKIKWLVPYFNDMSEIKRKSNHKDILFFGDMSRKENYLSAEWFIENVLQNLTDLEVRFVVLGGNPPKKLQSMNNKNILVTGFVDSIEPFFETAMCFVAPLVLGAGIKVKVLEAFSSGVPVLTNNIGIEGVPAVPDKDYIHCETPKEYENAIRNIFCNKTDIQEMERNARLFMKRYSLENSKNEYIKNIVKLGDKYDHN